MSHVVPSAFATGLRTGGATGGSFPCSPNSPSTVTEPTSFGRDMSCLRCSPASIRPLHQTVTASMRAIQWSASSCPAANAEITSKPRSENPPMFRMSARSASLRRLVRLDVQTNQPCLRIPLPEFRPLGHHRRTAAAALVDPRLVVRDEDHQIAFRFPLGSARRAARCSSCRLHQWKRAVPRSSSRCRASSAAPDDRMSRTASTVGVGFFRKTAAATSAATSMQRTLVVAPRRWPVTGTRHRTRNIGTHDHASVDRRHVRDRQFHRVLQGIPHLLRNAGVTVPIRRQQLVREHPRPRDLARIAQTRRDDLTVESRLFKYTVPRERVQVHARSLPRSIPRNGRPVFPGERQRREQHERQVRQRPGSRQP